MENNEVNKLIDALEDLIKTILEQENFENNPINKRHGYDQYPCITLDDLADIPRGIIQKIKNRPYEFSKNKLESMEYLSGRVKDSKHLLVTGLESYSYYLYFYSYTITIDWIDKYLYQSLEWEHLPEDTMPSSLRQRLAIQKRAVTNLEKSSAGLDEKVKQINSAYETARNLPTVQDDLKEAIEETRMTHQEINSIYKENKKKSDDFSESIAINTSKGKEFLKNIEELKGEIENIYKKCNEYRDKSAQAYSITNTNGLAGAFKERAKQLNSSAKWWTFGLIVALLALWFAGSTQVSRLQSLFTDNSVSTAAIILQAITALLSITAPLWFSWLATTQIHKLFKLSEDYGFKSSVSQSYEGYRKETSDISIDMLKDLMGNLLKIINNEPLRLVKDDTNASTPYNDIANQFFKRDKSKNDIEDNKKGSSKIKNSHDEQITDQPKDDDIEETDEN